jgi:hypothetical protein
MEDLTSSLPRDSTLLRAEETAEWTLMAKGFHWIS